MKEDAERGIQVAANVAIIMAATLLCAVLIKDYIIATREPPAVVRLASANNLGTGTRTPSAARPPTELQIQPGTKISLEGIDWAKNGKTLLMALSDKCHVCSESAPFYERLAKEHGNTKLIAILPQPIQDGKKYLGQMNVAVDAIKQSPLTGVGVKGTPTLILVDKNGVVINSWVGRLSGDRELEVLNNLGQSGATTN